MELVFEIIRWVSIALCLVAAALNVFSFIRTRKHTREIMAANLRFAKDCLEFAEENKKALAMAKRMLAERDAAIAFLKDHGVCDACARLDHEYGCVLDVCEFEWRGMPEEKKEAENVEFVH